jgi:hypothetical protein
MCRMPIGEGKWDEKIFEVMSNQALKEKNHGKDKRNEIASFINQRIQIFKIR